MAKKRTYHEFKQGLFKPENPKKCLNKTYPEYRSNLEKQVMVVLDRNPNVIQWSSEMVVIPYHKKVENRIARYFVDFYFKLQIGESVQEFIVEVKPHSQTIPLSDKPHGNKKKSTIIYEQMTHQTNTDKWEAARNWCLEQKRTKNRDIRFIIITEKNIDKILSS